MKNNKNNNDTNLYQYPLIILKKKIKTMYCTIYKQIEIINSFSANGFVC